MENGFAQTQEGPQFFRNVTDKTVSVFLHLQEIQDFVHSPPPVSAVDFVKSQKYFVIFLNSQLFIKSVILGHIPGLQINGTGGSDRFPVQDDLPEAWLYSSHRSLENR